MAVYLYENRQTNGLKVVDIIERTGLHRNALYRELENRGIEFNNGNRKVSEEVRYKALSLYFERETNKLTVRDIIMKT
ncbi:hypothetical protein ACQUY5_33200, partial [Bacillus cereus]